MLLCFCCCSAGVAGRSCELLDLHATTHCFLDSLAPPQPARLVAWCLRDRSGLQEPQLPHAHSPNLCRCRQASSPVRASRGDEAGFGGLARAPTGPVAVRRFVDPTLQSRESEMAAGCTPPLSLSFGVNGEQEKTRRVGIVH